MHRWARSRWLGISTAHTSCQCCGWQSCLVFWGTRWIISDLSCIMLQGPCHETCIGTLPDRSGRAVLQGLNLSVKYIAPLAISLATASEPIIGSVLGVWTDTSACAAAVCCNASLVADV